MEVKRIPFASVSAKQAARFWKKVARLGKNHCWYWIGAKKGKGYGIVKINKVNVGASRLGWLIVNGSDPYPLHVLHTCDNKLCCNPAHWFVGTNYDNIQEKGRKCRNARKLSPKQVSRIKRRLRSGESQQRIADDLKINQTLVSAIKRGVIWKYVE